MPCNAMKLFCELYSKPNESINLEMSSRSVNLADAHHPVHLCHCKVSAQLMHASMKAIRLYISISFSSYSDIQSTTLYPQINFPKRQSYARTMPSHTLTHPTSNLYLHHTQSITTPSKPPSHHSTYYKPTDSFLKRSHPQY